MASGADSAATAASQRLVCFMAITMPATSMPIFCNRRTDATAVVRYDQSGIDPQTGGYELVLTTCWPFDALTPGPERYILHATMMEPDS